MEKSIGNYSKWTPDLSSEALDHIEQIKSQLEQRLPLMREMRRALGLTQAEVAELLDVTQSNVSKIEIRDDPSLSVLSRIAEAKGRKLKLVVEADDGTVERTFAIG